MSTSHDKGSYPDDQKRIAPLHDTAAHAHESGAQSHGKQEYETGHERSRRALEHSPSPQPHAGQENGGRFNEHGIAMFGHEDIATLAHKLWQAKGCPAESADADWLEAAKELRARADAS
jgi:hypothetical protein